MSKNKHSIDSLLLRPVENTFTRSVLKYGSKPKSVAWRNKERQFRRFNIFSGLFSLVSRENSFTINDLGCGYGAMFEAYKNLPEFLNGRYFGYDISVAMLDEAKRQIHDTRAYWIHSHQATEEADFSFVSGTYNMSMNADPFLWQDYIESNLCHLWSKTRIALAFNMLSIHSPVRHKTLYYADPKHFVSFCSDSMDGSVRQIDLLAPEEFIIFILRDKSKGQLA